MSRPWSLASRRFQTWPSQPTAVDGWHWVLHIQAGVTSRWRGRSSAAQMEFLGREAADLPGQPADESSISGGVSGGNSHRDDSGEDDPRIGRCRIEAILFLANSPLPPRKLAQMAGLSDATEARTMIRGLNETYSKLGRAMRIELIAGGYRMMTRSAIAPWISRLSHVSKPVRLSTPMMETLAIVAYRGPVSRAVIESVRGVACGELLRQLMERDLVRIAGRSEELGRPYLYDTTKRFLQLFGLPNTEALPKIHWQALQDDSSVDDPTQSAISDSNQPIDSQPIDSSKHTKEPVVTNTLVSASPETAFAQTNLSVITDLHQTNTDTEMIDSVTVDPKRDPAAVIEDEEDDLYEGIGLEDDDEEEEEGWDDEDDWDDDESDDDGEDLEEDSWEEVDDSDSDEDDDSDEDWDGDEEDWDDDEDDVDDEDDDEDWD